MAVGFSPSHACRLLPTAADLSLPSLTSNTARFRPDQIPPCVFGSEAEGLLPPPGGEKGLPMDTPLFSRKVCHADYGHHGEMSLWQSYGVLV